MEELTLGWGHQLKMKKRKSTRVIHSSHLKSKQFGHPKTETPMGNAGSMVIVVQNEDHL